MLYKNSIVLNKENIADLYNNGNTSFLLKSHLFSNDLQNKGFLQKIFQQNKILKHTEY
ncbi:hypothetical protein NU08_1280 [Flavobacterium anhuiense]|uniref:Uncharacterized protein n=1 Tax=Flavobacterium anhuiense TaxID=459526 RepID=A0A444W140_9FLAO|nr:hypothetical protein NU08_1280 [Flavobacterium anhuiense]